jgi:hypothetical protein
MEVAGLGIGVLGLVGLFSTCLDMVERWDTYKDFGTEAEFFRARLYADKVRFQQWGQQVGISEDRRESHHHKALNDSSIRPAIDLILRSIKNIEDDAEAFASPLGHCSDPTGLQVKGGSVLRKDSILFEKSGRSNSRKSGLAWALGRKARVLKLVTSFEVLVQKLYDLIPLGPKTVEGRGHMVAGGLGSSPASSGMFPTTTCIRSMLTPNTF